MRNEDNRTQIIELVHKYFRCLDKNEMEKMRKHFAADFTAEHTLRGEINGIEPFIAATKASFPGLVGKQHYCTNHEIKFKGSNAKCRSYLFAQHVIENDMGQKLLPGGGRYLHEFKQHKNRWLIVRLVNDVTWMAPGLESVFSKPEPNANNR